MAGTGRPLGILSAVAPPWARRRSPLTLEQTGREVSTQPTPSGFAVNTRNVTKAEIRPQERGLFVGRVQRPPLSFVVVLATFLALFLLAVFWRPGEWALAVGALVLLTYGARRITRGR